MSLGRDYVFILPHIKSRFVCFLNYFKRKLKKFSKLRQVTGYQPANRMPQVVQHGPRRGHIFGCDFIVSILCLLEINPNSTPDGQVTHLNHSFPIFI